MMRSFNILVKDVREPRNPEFLHGRSGEASGHLGAGAEGVVEELRCIISSRVVVASEARVVTEHEHLRRLRLDVVEKDTLQYRLELARAALRTAPQSGAGGPGPRRAPRR